MDAWLVPLAISLVLYLAVTIYFYSLFVASRGHLGHPPLERFVDSAPPTFHAVLLCGRPTNWWNCIDGLKNNVIGSLGTRVLVFASVDASNEANDRIDDMFDTFSVLAGHREDYFATRQKRKTYEDVRLRNFESMCFHLHTAFSLLQDYLWQHPEERVGWVVKTRPDISPLTPVPLPNAPEPDSIYYLRSHRHYAEGVYPQEWLPDQFDAGDFDSMQRLCAVFDYMFVNSGDMPVRGETGVMEHELGIFVLQRWKLQMIPIDCDYDYFY